MEFKLEITYRDIPDKDKPNYELKVNSEFSDDAAKIIAQTLEAFQKVFAETKNNKTYV